MKSSKIMTILNLIISIFAWCLFLFNQLCNLRFLGLWVAWNLSGYAFALLVAPIAIIVAISSTVISCGPQVLPQKRAKYILTNFLCATITVSLELLCLFGNALLWE